MTHFLLLPPNVFLSRLSAGFAMLSVFVMRVTLFFSAG